MSFWSFQADALMPDEPYTVFPDGCVSISCVNTGTGQSFMALIGPRVTHLRPPFSKGTRIWGIRLWPDAIGPAFGVPARVLRDQFGALPRGATRPFHDLHDEIPRTDDPDEVFPFLDSWVTSVLRNAPDPDPRVRTAIHAIVRQRGEGSMDEVARKAAIGLRQLQRLFPDATGLTLREYARIRRLREALAMRLAPTAARVVQDRRRDGIRRSFAPDARVCRAGGYRAEPGRGAAPNDASRGSAAVMSRESKRPGRRR